MDIELAVNAAKGTAEANFAKLKWIQRFGIGVYTDPWIEWLLLQTKSKGYNLRNCRVIFILQDWGDEIDSDANGVNLLTNSLNNKDPTRDDATLTNIKVCLLPALLTGEAVIFNAVWARRGSYFDKCGDLYDSIHRAAFPVWAGMLKALSQCGASPLVCLCGRWARWYDTEWEAKSSGFETIKKWKAWSGDFGNEINPSDFKNLEFLNIHHPSANAERFKRFVKKMDYLGR